MFKLKALLFGCCIAHEPTPKDVDEELSAAASAHKQEHQSQPHSYKQVSPSYLNVNSPKKIQITDEDIKTGPKLRLIAIEGTLIPLNTQFLINPGGLENGGRGKNDGETFIGFIQKQKGDATIINDIALEDASVGGHHCMIRYHPDEKKYFLQDLGEGSGTFFKIEKELELKSGYIISFSDSHMLIHTRDMELASDESRGGDKKGNISIKFLDGPKVDEVFRFQAEDQTVRIGRMADCQIKFDDNNLSRYQCTFTFINNAWHIVDGYNSKPSTNGTWLLVDSGIELSHETVVKIGQTLFKVEIESRISKACEGECGLRQLIELKIQVKGKISDTVENIL